jgi:AsmA family
MTFSVKAMSRPVLRVAFALMGLLVVVGLVAPFIDATRYSDLIRRELESSLGRRVDFDNAAFSLFAGPGFSLENVTIYEDPRYGLEPFAYVGTLEARVRLDKLLLGKIQFASLRLVDPSLNLVKRNDGTWNVVELIDRLSVPRRMPLSLFPAVEVSDARIDFKFGTRKTTFYMTQTDISIYPASSGKLYIQFSGSPARTDRAGIGFGHLRGAATWYLNPPTPSANQLEANVTLDPSDLSELTTLFEGYDLGIHGTVSSQARIAGPANALRLTGELRLQDVHRWDLLTSQGEDWHIRYRGDIDVLAHSFDVETRPWRAGERTPVSLAVHTDDFLTQPKWTVLAHLVNIPAENMLPLCKRMGLAVPDGLSLGGTLQGEVAYSNSSGFSGGATIQNAVATLPNLPPIRAPLARIGISGSSIHFDPATIETPDRGTLEASGDYYPATQRIVTTLTAVEVKLAPLRETVSKWFGEPSALLAFNDGTVTGEMIYSHQGSDPASWSGQLQIKDGSLQPDGLAVPLRQFNSRVLFEGSNLDLPRFTAVVDGLSIRGEYHFNKHAKHPERLRIELPGLDLAQLQAALDPTLRAQGIWARLRFGRREIPAWMKALNLDGDVTVDRITAGDAGLGSLHARLVWEGATVQVTSLQLNSQTGRVRAHGSISLSGFAPLYRFNALASGFPWKGGVLGGEARIESKGLGADAIQNLQANGTFTATDVDLSPADTFQTATGVFNISFQQGWPNLQISQVQADDGDDHWEGQAASQNDGRLILDLQNAGHQRRVISTLDPATAVAPPLNKVAQQ